MKPLSPSTIRPPFGRYSHGIVAPAGARLVVTSGTLGVRSDDTIADSAAGQAAQCFANIDAILAETGLGPADVIRISAFVTERAHMADYMQARDDWLAGVAVPPASTLLIVSGFTRPEFKVEVEVTAIAR